MMPKSIAPMEMRLAGMPRRSSSMKAPSSETGTASATTRAERQLPSPRNSTSTSSTSSDAFDHVLPHGVQGAVDQLGAVVIRRPA